MRTVAIRRLDKITIQELTRIWNRCWQGYYYEMTFTVEQMQAWLHLGAVELEHSLLLTREDQVIGFTLLAREGEEAWIAGTSITPDARGQGFFAPLMQAQLDEASELGIKTIFLEVLSQNHAKKVYEAIGFEPIRQLNVFRLNLDKQSKLSSSSWSNIQVGEELQDFQEYRLFRPVSLAEYFGARSLESFNPPWQRREAYLSRYPNLIARLGRGGKAGLLFTGEQSPLLLDAWCSGPRDGRRVIYAILAHKGKIVLSNQPEDWLSAILKSFQIEPQEMQIEMRYNLR